MDSEELHIQRFCSVWRTRINDDQTIKRNMKYGNSKNIQEEEGHTYSSDSMEIVVIHYVKGRKYQSGLRKNIATALRLCMILHTILVHSNRKTHHLTKTKQSL